MTWIKPAAWLAFARELWNRSNPICAVVGALTKAGAHPGFTQYPEVGHFSWIGAYSDTMMMAWLFRQHK